MSVPDIAQQMSTTKARRERGRDLLLLVHLHVLVGHLRAHALVTSPRMHTRVRACPRNCAPTASHALHDGAVASGVREARTGPRRRRRQSARGRLEMHTRGHTSRYLAVWRYF
eukprot:3841179-Rhodomonas_salina.3